VQRHLTGFTETDRRGVTINVETIVQVNAIRGTELCLCCIWPCAKRKLLNLLYAAANRVDCANVHGAPTANHPVHEFGRTSFKRRFPLPCSHRLVSVAIRGPSDQDTECVLAYRQFRGQHLSSAMRAGLDSLGAFTLVRLVIRSLVDDRTSCIDAQHGRVSTPGDVFL
jgi:hypothetical protein